MSAAAELPPADPGVLARLRVYGRVVQAAGDLLATLDLGRAQPMVLPQQAHWQAHRLDRAVRAAQQAGPAVPTPTWPPRHAGLDRARAELRGWLATQAWADPGRGPWVYVYLLCFRDPVSGEHRPYRGRPRMGNGGQAAGHYTGSTIELPRRISEHLAGRNSVPLLEAALRVGLTFWLADVEIGTAGLEQRRKRQGSAYRRCPLCQGIRGPLDPTTVAATVPLPAPATAALPGGTGGCLGVGGGR